MAPPERTPAERSRANRDAQRMGWLYATALNFAGTVAVCTVLGYFLDRWLKTGPWLLITGLGLGLVGSTIKFARDGMAMNREMAAETRARKAKWERVEEEEGSGEE